MVLAIASESNEGGRKLLLPAPPTLSPKLKEVVTSGSETGTGFLPDCPEGCSAAGDRLAGGG